MIVYFTRKFILADISMPITPVATGGGGTGGDTGTEGGSELEAPGVEDAPAVNEPQIQDTISAVASAVSGRTAILADEQVDVGVQPTSGTGSGDHRTPGIGGGRGGGIGGGIGTGFGPGRQTGPSEPRREIRFEPATLLEYAQWLDYFKIELGVLGQDNKVYYAYNLSHDKPDARVGEPAQEQRLYMNPTDSQFASLDHQLAVKAGVADKGRIILQFYPPEAQAILVGLEQKHAGGANQKIFAVRSSASLAGGPRLNSAWKTSRTGRIDFKTGAGRHPERSECHPERALATERSFIAAGQLLRLPQIDMLNLIASFRSRGEQSTQLLNQGL